MRRSLTLLISLLIIASAPAGFASSRRERGSAPDFTLPTPSGTVSLRELQGKVVYVDFWASWCVPCRQSFPWMASVADKYGKQGLVVVAINLDKNREAADEFLMKYAVPFVVAFDPSGKTAERFSVQAMPSSFIISRGGTIIRTHEGFESSHAAAIEDEIKEALSQ